MPKILTGPLHNNAKDYLIKKARDLLNRGKGEKFCYLAPTPQLLADFRERLFWENKIDGVGRLNLYLFDGLVNELLKKNGLYRPVIAELEQEILLREVLYHLKENDKLDYFAGMVEFEGFYRGLVNLLKGISEQGLTDFEEIENILKELSGAKERELVLIIKEYYTLLKERELCDNITRYSNVFRLLEERNTLLGDFELFIIDGFQKFSGIQYRLIKRIAEIVPDFFINITYDENRPEIYTSTARIFGLPGFEREECSVVEDYRRPRTLNHLVKNLFKLEAEEIRADDALNIIEAPDREPEMRLIGRECKRLIHQGVHPEDIGIVVRKPDIYFNLVETVFVEYGLPYSFWSAGLPFLRTPVWKIIKDIYNSLETNLERKVVMNLLKSNLLNLLDPAEYDEAEELINTLQIMKGKDWFRLKGEGSPLSKKLYRQVKTIFGLRASFSNGGSFAKLASRLWSFLVDSGLIEGILQEENLRWVSRDLQALEVLKEILLKNEKIVGGGMGIKDFFYWLRRLLEQEQIKERTDKNSSIEIMTPSGARGREFKFLFIIGLLEGEFPVAERGDWFFSDEEKNRLKGKGFSIWNEGHLRDERFFFLSSIACARERLYLCYPSLGAEMGGPLVSSFVHEVKKLFYKDSLSITRVTGKTPLPSSLEEALTIKEAKDFFLEEKPLEKLQTLLPGLRAEINRWGNKYTAWDGLLKEQRLIDLVTRKYRNNYVFSASELETYANCPFRYFAGRVLRLADIEEPLERLDALNLGNLYHQILYLYFKEYFPGNWDNDWKEYESGVEEAAWNVFNLFSGASSLPEGMWELYQEEILKNLTGIIRVEWEDKGFIPRFLEVGFGLSADLEEEGSYNYSDPVEIKTPLGPVTFRGKIDRIDLAKDGSKALVWDYKFGVRYGSYQKMVEGYNLQLPLYILVADKILPLMTGSNVEIIGAAYYSITGNKKDGIWKADYEELIPVTSRSRSCLGSDDWEAHLQLFREHLAGHLSRLFNADFRIEPEDCSNCDFRDICRYEPRRMGGMDV